MRSSLSRASWALISGGVYTFLLQEQLDGMSRPQDYTTLFYNFKFYSHLPYRNTNEVILLAYERLAYTND